MEITFRAEPNMSAVGRGVKSDILAVGLDIGFEVPKWVISVGWFLI